MNGAVRVGVDEGGILCGELPERKFDDARRIAADAELEQEQICIAMLTDNFLVTIHGAAPALVLDEGVVKTHVLRHWCAADGAARHERA